MRSGFVSKKVTQKNRVFFLNMQKRKQPESSPVFQIFFKKGDAKKTSTFAIAFRTFTCHYFFKTGDDY
jgi:hypothetical protein